MTLYEEVNVAESLQRLYMHCFTVAGQGNNNDIKLDLLYVKIAIHLNLNSVN